MENISTVTEEEKYFWSLPEALRDEINRGCQEIARTYLADEPYRMFRLRQFIEEAYVRFGESRLAYVAILILEAMIMDEWED